MPPKTIHARSVAGMQVMKDKATPEENYIQVSLRHWQNIHKVNMQQKTHMK